MTTNPSDWQDYDSGSVDDLQNLRVFSYSDRIRYYWTDETVSAALDKLIANLQSQELPETIVSQFFMGLDFGAMPTDPLELISLQVHRCVERYFSAARC